MMAYKIQDYGVFGFCPLFTIVKTKEHRVSETGCVSILR
jgi:hypothetical protein